MAQHLIAAATAQARHPDQVAAVLTKLGTSLRRKDPSAPAPSVDEVSWSYRTAERIGPGTNTHAAHLRRGRARLELLGTDLFIGLEGRLGRRSAHEPLDVAQLLAGPDTSLPIETLGGADPLPSTGPKVWLWTPHEETAPGWTAHLITGARKAPSPGNPEGVLLELERGAATQSVWFDGIDAVHDGLTSRYAEVADAPRRKANVLDAAGMSALVARHAGPGGRWTPCLIEATVEELLDELSGVRSLHVGPGGITFGASQQPSEPPVPGPGPNARFFDTHESLAPDELAALASLEVPRLAVGRLDEMLAQTAASAPIRDVPREALRAVAQGVSVADAVAAGQARLAAHDAGVRKSGRPGLR